MTEAPSPTPDAVVAPDSRGAAESGSQTPVARALTKLSQLPDLPLAAHPDVYQAIHAEMQDALADIDEA